MEVERYVGVDVDGQVRGAYSLRWQFLWLQGERLLGAHYGYPISEGIIDKQYAMVGASVLRDAAKRCEYLYSLGAGGRTGNVFRVAQHAGWAIEDVPFLFRVINGGCFLRKLPQMQRALERRVLAAIGGATSLVQMATGMLHGASAIRHRGSSSLRRTLSVTVEEVATLGISGLARSAVRPLHHVYSFRRRFSARWSLETAVPRADGSPFKKERLVCSGPTGSRLYAVGQGWARPHFKGKSQT
jgi:hypothetical protein